MGPYHRIIKRVRVDGGRSDRIVDRRRCWVYTAISTILFRVKNRLLNKNIRKTVINGEFIELKQKH